MLQVIWTGAAGLCFKAKQRTILIDPYYSRFGIWSTLFRPIEPDEEAIQRHPAIGRSLDAIIVSHTHSDHVLDVPYIAAKHGSCMLVGSRSLDKLMQMHGRYSRVRVCQGGEKIILGNGVRVRMLRSTHGSIFGKIPFAGEISTAGTLPLKAKDYRAGDIFAPKLTINDKVFLHLGSADFIEAELQGHLCDVLCLCVTGWKNRAGYPETVMELTRPKKILLHHFDNLSKPHRKNATTHTMPFSHMQALVRQIKGHRADVEVIVPKIGKVMTL